VSAGGALRLDWPDSVGLRDPSSSVNRPWTNTREEKAAFVAGTYAALADRLGALHEESYVHVHDVRAEAYGYGGRTQAWRHHRAPA